MIINSINEKSINLLTQTQNKELITKTEKKYNTQKKLAFYICILLNIGILAYLKYFTIIANTLLHLNLGAFIININKFIIPIGISFYTFQCLGYLIDVERKVTKAEKNIFKYALFTSFFPILLQGPIHRYNDLAPQLFKPKCFSYDNLVFGIERIFLGLFKKIFVATQTSLMVNTIFNYECAFTGASVLLAAFLFGIQLYADFSGYVDIASGTAKMFGITLTENFNAPYFANSVSDFWRRWHISLSSWFRDYVFYPIIRFCSSSNINSTLERFFKKSVVRNIIIVIGLFITWFLIGLWHGNNLKFVCYGLYYGFFMILSVILAKQYSALKKVLKINEQSIIWKTFQIIRTLLIVNLGYVLFRAKDFAQAIYFYKKIFFSFLTANTPPLINSYFFSWEMVATGVVILLIIEAVNYKGNFLLWLHKQNKVIRWGILYTFFIITLVSLLNYINVNKIFMYYNF